MEVTHNQYEYLHYSHELVRAILLAALDQDVLYVGPYKGTWTFMLIEVYQDPRIKSKQGHFSSFQIVQLQKKHESSRADSLL